MSGPLKVAVVGHTNTGKTSLLRTLTRDVSFGEVSDRPSTTRHVEGTVLLVGGRPLLELYDTPGLEDAIGLLDYLDSLPGGRHQGPERVARFLESPAARAEFEQEAKVLRQLLHSDIALYVVDARERVLGKYQDELAVLALCARPILPVLNFVASREARQEEWRTSLARVGLHAVVAFDTVVYSAEGERRLYQGMQVLLGERGRALLDALIAERARQRQHLLRAAAELLAALLLDVAACRRVVALEPAEQGRAVLEELKEQVRRREQRCVDELLALFRFRAEDYAGEDLPIQDGQWGLDLFNPEALKQFGIRTGSAAAAGAMAGLAVDALVGGLSLGAATGLGAALGALWSASQDYGRRLAERLRGYSELRVAEPTLQLLALRQLELARALLRRGHASQERIRAGAGASGWPDAALPALLRRARAHPQWSVLNDPDAVADPGRLAALAELGALLERVLAAAAEPTALSAVSAVAPGAVQ